MHHQPDGPLLKLAKRVGSTKIPKIVAVLHEKP
jgi:hypothetical protein